MDRRELQALQDYLVLMAFLVAQVPRDSLGQMEFLVAQACLVTRVHLEHQDEEVLLEK